MSAEGSRPKGPPPGFDEQTLLDLPLQRPDAPAPDRAEEANLELFEEPRREDPVASEPEASREAAVDASPEAPSWARAGALGCWLAGFADAIVHIAVLAGVLVGASVLGVEAQLNQWPGYAAFLLIFSFFYSTVPLAFWGRTAGMAWWGLRARDLENDALSFRQAASRWFWGLFSCVLLGLPTLLRWRGSSLVERLSGTQTYVLRLSA